MPKSILIPHFFLPLSAVSLGRFVISLDHPHQNFHNSTIDASLDITENVQTQYESLHHSAKHENITSQLTTFLSSSFAKRLKTSIRITADQVKTYYLNNAGQWFRDIVKSQKTQEWIERTFDEGEDIYVIVVYHTLMNARVLEQLGGQSSTGGSLAIPVSMIVSLLSNGCFFFFFNFSSTWGWPNTNQARTVLPGHISSALTIAGYRWGESEGSGAISSKAEMKCWKKGFYVVN